MYVFSFKKQLFLIFTDVSSTITGYEIVFLCDPHHVTEFVNRILGD